jgi:hypothetical protein
MKNKKSQNSMLSTCETTIRRYMIYDRIFRKKSRSDTSFVLALDLNQNISQDYIIRSENSLIIYATNSFKLDREA